MDDIETGFRVGATLVPWGATLAEAAARLGVVAPPEARRRPELTVACGETCGLPALSATLTADGADRPVTRLAYELAADATPAELARRWPASLSSWAGAPARAGFHALPAIADLSGSVLWHGHWPLGEVALNLSVYGAPRRTALGMSGGCLWLSLSERRAAAPFVGAWIGRCLALADIAGRLSGIETFSVRYDLHGLAGGTAGSGKEIRTARAARLALSMPEILDTPDIVAARLTPRTFALWTSADDGVWAASTRWDTRLLRLGEKVKVNRIDLKPAKGGGWSGIEIGPWSVRDAPGSRSIADAADFLARIDGVCVTRHYGYDC